MKRSIEDYEDLDLLEEPNFDKDVGKSNKTIVEVDEDVEDENPDKYKRLNTRTRYGKLFSVNR